MPSIEAVQLALQLNPGWSLGSLSHIPSDLHSFRNELAAALDGAASARGNPVKTDQRDALTLASLARAGELTVVSFPEERDEAIRDLSRSRIDAVRARLKARQQLKAPRLRHGRRYTGKTSWNAAHESYLAGVSFDHLLTAPPSELERGPVHGTQIMWSELHYTQALRAPSTSSSGCVSRPIRAARFWSLSAVTVGGTAVLRSVVPVVLVSLAACHTAVLSPAGPVGEGERTVLLDSLTIMLAIVVPTIVAILTFAYWFRASNSRARYLPEWAYSGQLELIVWSIPALVVFFLGGIAWISAHLLDPAEPLKSKAEPLEVEAVSLDWKWLFIYPQQNVASINRMVVPAGVPLELKITSASVFNVFFVPQLGSEIYAMYGMTSRLNLQADRAGVYFGLSAHFSGDGFPGMAFDVHAVSGEQFTQWAAAARVTGPVLDEAAYRKLLKQSQDVSPYTYRSVQSRLFEDIVEQRLPPGEGPPTVQSAASGSVVLAGRQH